MENPSINNKFAHKTLNNENETTLLCCGNCLQTETNLFHCTNQLCNSNFCKNCLETNFSTSCLKCKIGKYVFETSSTQMKILESDVAFCHFCKKKFNSTKELKNHYILECEYVEIICPACHIKVPKIHFNSHICNPVNNNQMIDYLKESNQNLFNILGNVTNYFNKNEKNQSTLNTNNTNVVLPTNGNEDLMPNLNNFNITLNNFSNKIEEKFNGLIEEINELKLERNVICNSCKTRKPTEFCKNCSKRICEECAIKCKICELNICNKCVAKYENCKSDCNNMLCSNCLKLIINNKKIKIIDSQFENERLCTKDRCFRSRSFYFMNKYSFSVAIGIFLILYLLFK